MNALRSTLLVVSLLPTLLVGSGCQGKGDEAAGGPSGASAIGQPAPTLAARTIDGEPVALSDFRGQVVLVNIWATWCKPCTKELPELARLQRELSAQGFTVLGVSIDKRQMLPRVRSMVTAYQLGYPVLFDPESRAVNDWNVRGYPTTVLVGRDGTIRWRRDGMIHPNDPELSKQLETALAQPTPQAEHQP
ncbi:TlpA family protein disulfide reductase [Paraliomyxa miuraensis]|uniref:TlpA family protein disulfide reductase n=1 Tax=Paraliomyxa miuraensis TaxID=376150 RepID=UPI0022522F59|nr:TlpA disulfide reductase family protein [Paraliomyxa miuraensis]MCX4245658.1 TlpA family protein disulfide reductase [Paraliomyxa miuraensis]